MTLHEEWFDTLPSLNDPTGIHDYHLTIPSIRFGVPISEGENAGKIFYNLGQANEMIYSFLMYKEFQIKGHENSKNYTTLLLNCYIMQEKIPKLAEFMNKKEEKIFYLTKKKNSEELCIKKIKTMLLNQVLNIKH